MAARMWCNCRFAALPLLLFIIGNIAAGDVILTNQHVDLVVEWNGGWNASYDTDDFGVIPLAGTRIRIPASTAASRPGNPEFNFLGTLPGGLVWTLPQSQNPQAVWLGIEASGVGLASPVALTLIDVNGPGNVSLWNSGILTPPSVYWSTVDGLGGADVFHAPLSGHSHFNWSFTAPGLYDLTFSTSATLTGNQPTPTSTFQARFEVLAVPEPHSGLLLISALLGFAQRRPRRHNCFQSPRSSLSISSFFSESAS